MPSGTCKLRHDYLFTGCARLDMSTSSNAAIIDSSQVECSISALGVCSVYICPCSMLPDIVKHFAPYQNALQIMLPCKYF